MTVVRTPYIELTCNGRINNLRHPNCSAVSDGGFDEALVITSALAAGWTDARGHLCPGCSRKQAPAADVVDVPRRVRKVRNEPAPSEHQDYQEHTG